MAAGGTIDWDAFLLSALRIGLSHDEFWGLTPKEVSMSIEAFNRNKEEELQIVAWAVSLIVSYTGRLKKPITPDKLLGKSKPKRIEPEEKRKEWNALLSQFKEVR